MNSYEKLREYCNRCHNCNSNNQLEIHHRIFRSEWDLGVKNNILLNKKIYEEGWWKQLHLWWLNDIENLVLLCAKCHKQKIHWGDDTLREYYKNSFTEPNTFMNIPFKKPNKTLF